MVAVRGGDEFNALGQVLGQGRRMFVTIKATPAGARQRIACFRNLFVRLDSRNWHTGTVGHVQLDTH